MCVHMKCNKTWRHLYVPCRVASWSFACLPSLPLYCSKAPSAVMQPHVCFCLKSPDVKFTTLAACFCAAAACVLWSMMWCVHVCVCVCVCVYVYVCVCVCVCVCVLAL